MRKTKIVCTLGPATDKDNVLEELIKNGLNVARCNFSHGSHEEHLGRMNKVKELREKCNKPVAILLDTKGPEIRTGNFENGKVHVFSGQTFTLVGGEKIIGDENPESATRPLESIRPKTTFAFVLMPCARAMFWFAPVARIAQPRSVPKNQYKSAITANVKRSSTGSGFFTGGERLFDEGAGRAHRLFALRVERYHNVVRSSVRGQLVAELTQQIDILLCAHAALRAVYALALCQLDRDGHQRDRVDISVFQ